MSRASMIWSDDLLAYGFNSEHPMNPRRLELAVDLLHELRLFAEGVDLPEGRVSAAGKDLRERKSGECLDRAEGGSALGPEGVATPAECDYPEFKAAGAPDKTPGRLSSPTHPPRPATEEDLLLAHAPEYIAAVRRLSEARGGRARDAHRWGLGTEDTPVMPGMHEAASLVVGATLTAAELVMSGRARRAFNPAGGLHHAHRARASGFCIYNDLAVAIRWMQREHGARVMYIDYDAHHGDGVQGIFYEDPEVLTVSFHESGTYLYPGTGFIDELGTGDGYGYSVNVPLDAGTEDDSWRAAFLELVPALADAFRPDVIVLQNGCDGHVLDPLTHLRATTGLFEEFVRIVGEVADRHCEGRIVATGGGGYAIHTVVPRAWTLVWGALCGTPAPDPIPADWLAAVEAEAGGPVPATLRDPPGAFPPFPRRAEVEATNDLTVRAVRRRVLPLLTGWGLAF